MDVHPISETSSNLLQSSPPDSKQCNIKSSGEKNVKAVTATESKSKTQITVDKALTMLDFDDHKCVVFTPRKRVFLGLGCFLYCVDVLSDLYVAIATLVNYNGFTSQLVLGSAMIFFVLMPLAYGNYVAQKRRYNVSCFFGSNITRKSVWHIDQENVKGRPIKRTLCPYNWDSKEHVLLNLVCMLQLGVVISSLELYFHKESALNVLSKQYAHYTAVRKLEATNENCPQLMLQICALVLSFKTNTDMDNAIRILSISISMLSFPLAVTTDHESERFAGRTDYDLLLSVLCCCGRFAIPVQLLLLYFTYLTMVVSRVMFITCLYLYFRSADTTKSFRESVSQQYVPVILVGVVLEIHHYIIVAANLINRYRTVKNPKVKVVNKILLSTAIISYYIASFSELFVILLNFPASYLRAVGPKARSRAPRRKSLIFFYLLNLAELVVLAIMSRDLLELRYLGCYYIPLYLVSGFLLLMYNSPVFYPDNLKQKHPYKLKTEGRGIMTCKYDPSISLDSNLYSDASTMGNIGSNIQEYITTIVK